MPTLPDGMVWLASYPKSGNTWMRALLSNLIGGADQPEDINDLALRDGIASGRGIFEEQTLVDSHLLTEGEAEALRPSVLDAYAVSRSGGALVKVHDAYTHLLDGTPLLGRAGRAALYLVRDPRDVAVSFAFHLSVSLDEAIDLMNNPTGSLWATNVQFRQLLTDWSGHVCGWLDQTDLPVHLIRYEDLWADTPGEFCRALDFLGIRYEEEAAVRAVRHADFAELQRQERRAGFRERAKGQTIFFRQGQVGDWRRHLSAAQVRTIETAHAAVMARLGYERMTEDTAV
ncbi:sulfotransferase domain-containing protein [Azospirillum sp. sgz301742]